MACIFVVCCRGRHLFGRGVDSPGRRAAAESDRADERVVFGRQPREGRLPAQTRAEEQGRLRQHQTHLQLQTHQDSHQGLEGPRL